MKADLDELNAAIQNIGTNDTEVSPNFLINLTLQELNFLH